MRIRVAAAAELGERTTRKFWFECHGRKESGFVARHDGRVVAYVNRCRHQPMPLDWDDGEFYVGDERDYFMCRTHGAVYEPLSGTCVMGPCTGRGLEALAVEEVGGEVWVETEPGPPAPA